jgi:hypothetical protein
MEEGGLLLLLLLTLTLTAFAPSKSGREATFDEINKSLKQSNRSPAPALPASATPQTISSMTTTPPPPAPCCNIVPSVTHLRALSLLHTPHAAAAAHLSRPVSIDENVTYFNCFCFFIPLQSATSSVNTQRHLKESTCSTLLKPKCALEKARCALLALLPPQAEMRAEAARGVRTSATEARGGRGSLGQGEKRGKIQRTTCCGFQSRWHQYCKGSE